MYVLAAQRQKIIDRLHLTEDYINMLMILVKQRLGIRTDVKNTSIEARILASILSFSDTRGIKIDPDSTEHLMLLVDIAAWEHGNLSNPGPMPIDLRYRLNNVILSKAED